jgi:hypothetical protein
MKDQQLLNNNFFKEETEEEDGDVNLTSAFSFKGWNRDPKRP